MNARLNVNKIFIMLTNFSYKHRFKPVMITFPPRDSKLSVKFTKHCRRTAVTYLKALRSHFSGKNGAKISIKKNSRCVAKRIKALQRE